MAGGVLQPGPPGPLLVAAHEQRAQPHPAPHQQRAGAGRAAHLVGAHAHQVGAEVGEGHGEVARGLGRVHVHEHASLAACGHDLGHRLQRADLVVAPLEVDERGVGADRADHLGGVDVAEGVAADHRHLVPFGRQAHRGVLDRRYDEMIAPLGRAEDRVRDRLRRPAGEHHLAGAGTDQRRDLVARRLDRDPLA